MSQTANYGFEKPSTDKNVDEEFYQLQETLDLLDSILAALHAAVNGKAAATHTHAIGDVVNLAAELAAKMPASATFTLDDLTDVSGADGAPNGYVLVKSALGWLPSSALAALGTHGHLISEITGLVAALAGKSDVGHVHTIADVAGLATDLAGRVSKTGDTMSGNLTIDKTDAAIVLAGDNRQWYWQALENGGSPFFRLVDMNANADAFRVGTDGSLWCRQLGDINTRIETKALAYANDRVANMSFRRTSRGEIAVNTTRAVRDTPAGSVMTGLNLDNDFTVGIRYDYLQMYDPVRGWVTMQG